MITNKTEKLKEIVKEFKENKDFNACKKALKTLPPEFIQLFNESMTLNNLNEYIIDYKPKRIND